MLKTKLGPFQNLTRIAGIERDDECRRPSSCRAHILGDFREHLLRASADRCDFRVNPVQSAENGYYCRKTRRAKVNSRSPPERIPGHVCSHTRAYSIIKIPQGHGGGGSS